jgi:hypothetical protein
MNSMLSVTIVSSLIVQAIPLRAQEKMDTGARSLERAITREAMRMAAEQDKPLPPGWSRVVDLTPGIEIVVTVDGSGPQHCYFLVADESSLIVLNLLGPALPPAATRALLEIAASHPRGLSNAQQGATFIEAKLRIEQHGIFWADRKIAEVGEIVRKIDHRDVAVIQGPLTKRGSVPGAIIGAGAGFAVGLLAAVNLAYKYCGRSCDDEKVLIGLSLVGLPILGGVIGYRIGPGRNAGMMNTIYRAP